MKRINQVSKNFKVSKAWLGKGLTIQVKSQNFEYDHDDVVKFSSKILGPGGSAEKSWEKHGYYVKTSKWPSWANRFIKQIEPIASSPIDEDHQHVEIINPLLTGVTITGKIDLSPYERTPKEIHPDKKNLYIIDTNIFIDQPDIIHKIPQKYTAVLALKVVEELDSLKVKLDSDGRIKVQKAINSIHYQINQKRDILFEESDLSLLPEDLDRRSSDNRILSICLKYRDENPILLTSDNILRLKATGMNLKTLTLKEFLRKR